MLKQDTLCVGLNPRAIFGGTIPAAAGGAAKTWAGGASRNGSTNANGNGGESPVDSEELLFPPVAASPNTNDISRREVRSFIFDGSNYTICGFQIWLTNGFTDKQVPGGNTLELDIALDEAQTFACRVAAAGRTISGNITNARCLLTIRSGGDTLFNGLISGAEGPCRTAVIALPGPLVIGGGSGTDAVLKQLPARRLPWPSIAQANLTNVDLWWPTNFDGYTLTANTNMSTNVWSVSGTNPVVIPSNYHLTNPASGPQRFYRPCKP